MNSQRDAFPKRSINAAHTIAVNESFNFANESRIPELGRFRRINEQLNFEMENELPLVTNPFDSDGAGVIPIIVTRDGWKGAANSNFRREKWFSVIRLSSFSTIGARKI